MKIYNNSIVVKFDTATSGNAGSGKYVTVFDAGTGIKAPLFDENIVPIDNPVQADNDGNYTFNINDGLYDLTIDEGLPSVYTIKNEQIADNSPESIFAEEALILSAGQTTVTFNTAKSEFYIGSKGVDRGKLFENVDYSVTNDKTIELFNSYPDGSYCVGTSSATAILTTKDVKNINNINTAINDIGLLENDALNLKEIVNGDGQSSMWDAVLSASVVTNGDNIRQCLGAPSLAIVRRTYKEKASSEMYRRSLVYNFAGFDDTFVFLTSAYSYTSIYPTALSVDEVANEIYIARTTGGGDNDWGWVWVYDLNTGIFKSSFTFEVDIYEGMVIKYDGLTRWIYSLDRSGNVFKADITTLPANYGTVAFSIVATGALTQITSSGDNFLVTDGSDIQGRTRRSNFNIYDSDFNKISTVAFSQEVTGTFGTYIDDMAKSQAVTYHKGEFYFGTGTLYFPSAPVDTISRYSGIQSSQADGTIGIQALLKPEDAITHMEKVIGHDMSAIENEGIYSTGPNLYALWVTLNPPQWDNPGMEGQGIALTLELSNEPDRVDFSADAVVIPKQFNLEKFNATCHHSSTQLTNPYTLDTIDTFQDIIDMMLQLQITTYQFYGNNQVITDVNAVATPTEGSYIRVTNTSGDIQLFEYQSTTTMKLYKTTGKGAAQTEANITFT